MNHSAARLVSIRDTLCYQTKPSGYAVGGSESGDIEMKAGSIKSSCNCLAVNNDYTVVISFDEAWNCYLSNIEKYCLLSLQLN